jgi:hypothetical protein
LRTRIAVLAVWVVPSLAETRDSGFQHQTSATPVSEMCETSQCSESNYRYCSACFVFNGIGTDYLKNARPHKTINFSDCKVFWWKSQRFSFVRSRQILELTLP